MRMSGPWKREDGKNRQIGRASQTENVGHGGMKRGSHIGEICCHRAFGQCRDQNGQEEGVEMTTSKTLNLQKHPSGAAKGEGTHKLGVRTNREG
ncbi:unnamed protein product [Prunus armeniaca]|uniref:Uncharacterized protein n=1 Tax=Prunus armeniaca TaxID=36596 RepID=A0A6J5XKK7_PRUAR|nr:unnamed protein product [Prunus armeniaca]